MRKSRACRWRRPKPSACWVVTSTRVMRQRSHVPNGTGRPSAAVAARCPAPVNDRAHAPSVLIVMFPHLGSVPASCPRSQCFLVRWCGGCNSNGPGIVAKGRSIYPKMRTDSSYGAADRASCWSNSFLVRVFATHFGYSTGALPTVGAELVAETTFWYELAHDVEPPPQENTG